MKRSDNESAEKHLRLLSKIATVLKENRRMTLGQIVEKTGLSQKATRKHLKDLEERNLIQRIGNVYKVLEEEGTR